MHSTVFQGEALNINCVHNSIFFRIWGVKCITALPSTFFKVAIVFPPPGHPCGGPHIHYTLPAALIWNSRKDTKLHELMCID